MRGLNKINNMILGMPIQTSPYKKIDYRIRTELKRGISKGAIIVIPAGNYGPMINTMNPWSRLSNLIIVGGAKNDGSDLCEFSSRGIPNSKYSGPTIVCPSEDLIGMTHSGITQLIEEKEKKLHLFTRERFEEQINKKISDEEWEEVLKKYVIGTGTSQAVEYLVKMITWIIYYRRQRGFLSDIKSVKNILIDMAVPISGYNNHEIGAGFVSLEILNNYLALINRSIIKPNMKKYWGDSYKNKFVIQGETRVGWIDNTSDPNQIDFTDEK